MAPLGGQLRHLRAHARARTRRASRRTASSTTSARSAAGGPWRPVGIARAGPVCPCRRRRAVVLRAAARHAAAPAAVGRAAHPQPPLARRAGDRRGGRALQRQLPQAHDRGPDAQPRLAARGRGADGDRRHRHRRRLGDLVVPVSGEPGRVRPRADDRALRRGGAGSGRHRLERRRRSGRAACAKSRTEHPATGVYAVRPRS